MLVNKLVTPVGLFQLAPKLLLHCTFVVPPLPPATNIVPFHAKQRQLLKDVAIGYTSQFIPEVLAEIVLLPENPQVGIEEFLVIEITRHFGPHM